MKKKDGFLIVFEGIDGSGKSTQARLLAKKLKNEGFSVLVLREPTRSRWGRQIKAKAKTSKFLDPQEELALFLRDREDNVKRNILPALSQGKIVILDRYYFSTMAYQGARGIDPVYIRKLNEAFAPKPDMVFILHLPAREGLKRISHRRRKDILFEQEAYLEKVEAIFQSLKGRNFYHLEASQSKQKLAEIIFNRVISLLKKKKLHR